MGRKLTKIQLEQAYAKVKEELAASPPKPVAYNKPLEQLERLRARWLAKGQQWRMKHPDYDRNRRAAKRSGYVPGDGATT